MHVGPISGNFSNFVCANFGCFFLWQFWLILVNFFVNCDNFWIFLNTDFGLILMDFGQCWTILGQFYSIYWEILTDFDIF